MNKILKFGAAILAAGTLAGCGDEDFSGAYITDGAYGKQIVLNVSGDDAKIFLVGRSTAEISGLIDFEVDYKNGKLLLDSTKENIRLTFKRGADERGLECLNCNDGGLRLPAKWALLKPNVINLSCSPAQGKPPEAASRHGRRAMTRPLPLNQAV